MQAAFLFRIQNNGLLLFGKKTDGAAQHGFIQTDSEIAVSEIGRLGKCEGVIPPDPVRGMFRDLADDMAGDAFPVPENG